jgi:hypothetical protein
MASGQGSPETMRTVTDAYARAFGFARALGCAKALRILDTCALRRTVLCCAFLVLLFGPAIPPIAVGQRSELSFDSSATFDGQLRFVWGGKSSRAMRGTLSVSYGNLTQVRNLSQSIHSIGSVQKVAPNILQIDQPVATSFGGLDLHLDCPLDAELLLRLENAGADPFEARYRLRDLLAERKLESIDSQGTRIAIERMVFDSFRIESAPKLDVVTCGSKASVQAFGYRTPLVQGAYQLEILLEGNQKTERILRQSVTVDKDGGFPAVDFELSVPAVEGVYQLVAIMRPQRTLPSFYSTPEWIRRVEFVAFDPAGQPSEIQGWDTVITQRFTESWQDGILEWFTPVAERTSKALQSLTSIPVLSKNESRVGNGNVWNVVVPAQSNNDGSTEFSSSEMAGINAAQFPCLKFEPNSWRAVPLGRLDTTKPHRLTIRAPAPLPGDLSFSIRGDIASWQDPSVSASGFSDPIGNDYRIERHRGPWVSHYQEPSDLAETLDQTDAPTKPADARLISYSVLFWPPESESFLCLANTNESEPTYAYDFAVEVANFTGLTNSSTQSVVKRASATQSVAKTENTVGTVGCGFYIDKPLLHSMLGARRSTDSQGENKLESWSTTYFACQRLVNALSDAKANLLILKVQADGGLLFDSDIINSTTRFDSGTFFTDGRTPSIKDAVKLLMQFCARRDIRVVLSVDYEGPLPSDYAPKSNQASNGLAATVQTRDDGQASERINPLSSSFDRYLTDSINELLARYAEFESFAGIQIQVDRLSQFVFKGDRWGFQVTDISEFRRARGTSYSENPADWTVQQLQSFLRWRAQRIAERIRSINERVSSARPGAKLFVDLSRLWDAPLSREDFREPNSLSRNPSQFLLSLGIDLAAWQAIPGLGIQRSTTISSRRGIDADQWVRSIARKVAIGPQLHTANQAQPFPNSLAFVYEQPDTVRVSIDSHGEKQERLLAKSMFPFDLSPFNASRVAILRHLACSNPQLVAVGSWLPNGADLLELADLYAILRERPLLPFQPAIPIPDSKVRLQSSGLRSEPQDVIVSIARDQQNTYLQMINLCPWEEQLTLLTNPLTRSPRVRALGSGDRFDQAPVQTEDHWQWNFSLRPFEIQILEIGDTDLQVLDAVFAPSDQVMVAVGDQLRNLRKVLEECQDPTLRDEYYPLEGGFEEWEPNSKPQPKGWSISTLPNVRFQQSREFPHSGRSSVKVESQQPGNVPAWIQSQKFAPPRTGRLQIEVWMRCPTIESTTKVRVSLFGRNSNGERYESSKVFGGSNADPALRIANDWGPRPALLDVGDIPIEEVDEVFVSIELLGTGSVWIDDVKVRQSWLHPSELRYMNSRLLLAEKELENNHLLAAYQLLESDWGRYLNRLHPAFQLPPLEIQESNEARQAKSTVSKSQPAFGKEQESWRDRSAWGRTSKLFEQMRRSMLKSWQR